MSGRFLRMSDVMSSTGLRQSTIYDLVAAGRFPKSHKLVDAPTVSIWLETDVEAWKAAQIRGIAWGIASQSQGNDVSDTGG